MFNDDMRTISRVIYLQTRYCRGELLNEGIHMTRPLSFGINLIDQKHWGVEDLELYSNDLKNSLELKKNIVTKLLLGTQGVLVIGDINSSFFGLLYSHEGVIAQYDSKHSDTVRSLAKYNNVDDCDKEQEGDLYKIKIGDPYYVPDMWYSLMSKGMSE